MGENGLNNGHSLVEKIKSVVRAEPDFPQKFKQRLVMESYQVKNPSQFISSLFSKGFMGDEPNDTEEISTLKEMMVQLAIRIACSRGADAMFGLVQIFDESENLHLNEAIGTWLQNNFEIGGGDDCSESKRENAVVQAPRSEQVQQQTEEESKLVGPEFLYQNVPPNELLTVATFNDQPDSSVKGTSALYFDKKGMMAGFSDGTIKMWNWINNEEKAFKCGTQAVNCLEYDEEIIVLGTQEGIVYLYDVVKLEEKWSIRLCGPVISLKFFKSTLVVFAGVVDNYKLWWIEISRPDMRLLNQRHIDSSQLGGKLNGGVFIDSDHCFVCVKNSVYLYDTKLGISITDEDGNLSCFSAPAEITTLKLPDLVFTKRILVAGCLNGDIVMWSTSGKISTNRGPIKTFRGHQKAIRHICNINGHLVSVDETDKVLMWSGYDLESHNVLQPVPRALGRYAKLELLG